MIECTYKEMFRHITIENTFNVYMFLYPCLNSREEKMFMTKTKRFSDDELLDYDEALKKFKSLFKRHFQIIHEGDMDSAKNWIGQNTGRGVGNFIVDNKYMIYTSVLDGTMMFDGPFHVVNKGGKYLVNYLDEPDSSIDVSDYGLRLNK